LVHLAVAKADITLTDVRGDAVLRGVEQEGIVVANCVEWVRLFLPSPSCVLNKEQEHALMDVRSASLPAILKIKFA
jgi:hypothetical protein